jgi:hypothetical protein
MNHLPTRPRSGRRARKCRPFKDEVDIRPVHVNPGIRVKTESATTIQRCMTVFVRLKRSRLEDPREHFVRSA